MELLLSMSFKNNTKNYDITGTYPFGINAQSFFFKLYVHLQRKLISFYFQTKLWYPLCLSISSPWCIDLMPKPVCGLSQIFLRNCCALVLSLLIGYFISFCAFIHSLSNKTTYCHILWWLKAMRLCLIIIVLLWNLTGILAALLSRCLSNFRIIGNAQIWISQLRESTRSCGKMSVRLVNRGPRLCL